MKQSLIVGLCGIFFAGLLALPVAAGDGERGGHHRGHHGKMQQVKFVMDYMIEAGDITQAEIDERMAARKALREELKALHDSGDEEAFKEGKLAMKASMKAQRAEIKAYIESHEDLQAQLKEQRKAMKSEYRGHHHEG